MPVTHRKTSDPKYVHDAPTLYNFKCVRCGDQYSDFSRSGKFCETCQAYSYVIESMTQSDRTKDIMNRVYEETEQDIENREKNKKTFDSMWEDGMVKHPLIVTIREESGTKTIKLIARKSKEAWLNHIVEVKVGNKSLGHYNMSSIAQALQISW
jgi:predicted  nucleic acid-binding Zn-ribbon protein